MPQHFLLSTAARTLTVASVARMRDEEVERVFIRLRWQNSEPHCPRCGCFGLYQQRKATGLLRWRCKACNYNFSITSGTLFHSRKMPLRGYLMAIAIFANEVKGKSMLAMARDLGTSYKASYVLAHKMREAMAAEVKQHADLGASGKSAAVDGGYF